MTIADEDFDEFYRAHRGLVRSYLRRRVSDEELCDDLCADVFELAYRKFPAGHTNAAGWLIKTASHLLRSATRGRQREQSAIRDHLVVTAPADGDSEPRAEGLELAWARLPERHREVLQLLFWEQLSVPEIAVALDCSEQVVWKRASRARAALRALWPDPDEGSGREVTHAIRTT